jgi:DNA-binding winged helix-turn-helix (wHTH) protein/tetratricopeptide (TPR) repeat protein
VALGAGGGAFAATERPEGSPGMDAATREGVYYGFGPFVLDPTRRVLTRDGAAVSLFPTVFETLLYLVEHPGRVVSRDELMDAIWPRRVVEDANISQTIFTLRKALTEAGARETYVATQPGQGYRFVQPVRTLTGAPAPFQRFRPDADAPGHAGAPWRRTWAAAAGLVLLACAGLGFWLWSGRAGPPGPSKVVVLAEFENLTGEPLFDRTFAEATRIDLFPSPYLTVLAEPKVQNTLALMTRSKDERLVPAVAQEVCARNNGMAAVRGSVAKVGTRYLLTVTAADCASGDTLDAEKAEVSGHDGLLPALDAMVKHLRRRLGESAGSVRRFSVPLVRVRTASLDAVKSYSDAQFQFNHGRRIEAIPLFQRAIALDPNFATAYGALSVVYANLRENDLAAANATKAYALRDSVDERERFFIAYRYNTFVTQDVPEGLRLLRGWTQSYPADGPAWANLSNKENWVGQYALAIADGRRALSLEPDVETAYVVLARAALHAGQWDLAQRTCAQAIAHGVDGDDLHGVLFQLAIARGDAAGALRQMQWAEGKPGERSMLIEAGQAAFRGGQVRRGLDLFQRALDLGKGLGLSNFMAAPNAQLLQDLGRTDLARQSLAQVPDGFDSADYRFTLAEIGDTARAEALLRHDLAKSPTDTLLTQVFAPEQRAAAALRQGRPVEALKALRSTLPYDLRTYDVPYLRGRAYLAEGDGAQAAAEFQKILENPGVEPVSEHYPLAELGLARAFRIQRDVAASRGAYQRFFIAWKDADPDQPLLRAAEAEYVKLPPITR